MAEIIEAPWTPAQVHTLNRFQQLRAMHPFTCGADHDEHRVLVAEADGWHCPDPECGYRQSWAHAFMADPVAFAAFLAASPLPLTTPTQEPTP